MKKKIKRAGKKMRAKKSKKSAKKMSKREACKLVCGCHSGRKWEECCGRCTLPC